MEYNIIGGQLPAVVCNLKKGERIYTESGGMSWMSSCFHMETNTKGGLLKGLGRSLAGESLFMTTYECTEDGGEIAFSCSFPGKLMAIRIQPGQSIIMQKNSFLAATEGVDISLFFRKKLGAGFFGGEGFILQKATGEGVLFVEFDGDIVEKDLAPGEMLKVDQGYIAMFDPTVNFDITTVKGVSNVLFSGEGLFLAMLTGPGRVYLQTMPFSNLANKILSGTNGK